MLGKTSGSHSLKIPIMSVESFNNQNAPGFTLFQPRKNIVPDTLDVSSEQLSVTKLEHYRQFVYLIQESAKEALAVKILRTEQLSRVVIYVRTNSAADHLAETLNRSGITAESVHNNKSQRTKSRSFSNFLSSATDVLVATESAQFAFKTIEVDAIINYDLPVSAETYLERLTRHPGRLGIIAKVLSFCDSSEDSRLTNINRVLKNNLEIIPHNINQPG